MNIIDSGLLNINKPSGISSFGVVKKVKYILGAKKVGHCGTLDPMAEGVLLVVFGSATKKQDSLMIEGKTYRAVVLLGTKTDTGDITGKILENKVVPSFSKIEITKAMEKFKGEIKQLTPSFSAVKRNGIKMYELARKGIFVERPPRIVNIYKISLLDFSEKELNIRVECSSGTYIRTLAEDIGAELGVPATLKALCRERVGNYGIESSISWDKLCSFDSNALLNCKINI